MPVFNAKLPEFAFHQYPLPVDIVPFAVKLPVNVPPDVVMAPLREFAWLAYPTLNAAGVVRCW